MDEWPCIDITHTRGWEERDRDDDAIPDYASFLAWSEQRGLVSPEQAGRLARQAQDDASAADEVHRSLVALRAALFRVLEATATGGDPSENDVKTLNAWIERAASRRRVAAPARDAGDGPPGEPEPPCWVWVDDAVELDLPVRAVARSAAELLTGELADRIRFCAADDCGWLFLDRSRNRSRRWCDMADCGNRAKVRNFRARHASS